MSQTAEAAPATARPSPPRQRLIAATAWMFGALVSFSLIAIAGREASRVISTAELMFWRTLIGVAVLLIILFAAGGRPGDLASTRMRLHGVRAVIHFGAQFSWLYALTLIPLIELFALEFTAPLWVAVLAPLILGERVTPVRLAAAAIGFAGALIVIRPGTATFSLGTVIALASALGFALSMIATKSLTRTDGTLKIIFWMNGLQLIIAAGFAMRSGLTAMPLATWGYVAVVALCGLTAHFALTRAFSLADAILVAPMDFLRVPLIALIGSLLYGETLEPFVLIGGACILAANSINLWGERRAKA
jgi:drug/metabolite transporter (DMT)-like permease